MHDASVPSLWMRDAHPLATDPLAHDAAADVCVVGAGIAGLTAAYLLLQEGSRVVVIDSGAIGGGQTARTTAHLASGLSGRIRLLERTIGLRNVRKAASAHREAINEIERIVVDEAIDCDLARIDGYLFSQDRDRAEIEDEFRAATDAGVNCELVASAPVKRLDSGLAIRFLHQGRLHPLRYALGLATAVQRLGGQLYSSTAARPLVAGSEGRVETESGGTVRAQAVVLATHQAAHSWLPSRGRLTPQRSYAIAAPVDPTSCADALYWDTRSPRHSVRLHQSGGQWMLIAGGEDQQGGEERASLDRLERWMRDRFTITGLVECRWSGEVLEPADVLGYAGRVATSGNVYVISGESGHGMTHGTLGAMLVRDLIIGRQTHWEDLFDPSREPIPIGERRSSPAPTS